MTGASEGRQASKVFLSHNAADKPFARRLGSQLALAGAEVWFDEWEIRAGDSLTAKINEGLAAFDTFVLIWSEDAARSKWVGRELAAALARGIKDGSLRVIPVLLDETEFPALLADLRYLRGDLPDSQVAAEILGLAGEREWLMAIQATLEYAGIDVGYFPGYGAIVGCPNCGAGLASIEGWHDTDFQRGDEYAGARCRECRWSDGGEL